MTSPTLTTTRDELAESLKRLKPGLANSPTIRADISGTTVRLSTEDSEVAAVDTFGITAGVDGTLVLPTASIQNILKVAGDGNVTIAVNGKGRVAVDTAGGSYALATVEVENLRTPQIPEAADQVTVDAATFADAVNQVAPAAAAGDSGRPVLGGVFITHYSDDDGSGLRLVATDSLRLAIRNIAGAGKLFGDAGAIVPADALSAALKVLSTDGELHVRHDEYRVAFADHRTIVVMSVINAEFPAYDRVVPTEHTGELTVARDELAAAVRRAVAACTSNPTLKVRFADHAEISAHQSDVADGSSDPVGAYSGNTVEFGFNHELLLDGIKSCHDGELTVQCTTADRAITLRNSALEDFTYILMPVRIS